MFRLGEETPVLAQRAKTAVRSAPFLYGIFRSVASVLGVTKDARLRREMARARQYCVSLPRKVAKPVFVKVGANDGITGDPFSEILLANEDWTGLLIEPAPNCFDRLKANFHDGRRFSLDQVAIGASASKASFYYMDQKAADFLPNLPSWYDQLGSFDRNHIVKHLGSVAGPFIIECQVEVLPLPEVTARNGIEEIHLLHIDTEGYDYDVLKTVDFANHPPLAVFVEHKHLSDAKKIEMLDLLRKCGYSVRDCGGDYFAVNKKTKP